MPSKGHHCCIQQLGLPLIVIKGWTCAWQYNKQLAQLMGR